ncbi:M24 family metallopeptidase [Motilibacter deserti]|uniref:Aminopeptidase P family protein n=1 Tax=Motilibacter deserti TaxID=2714956 RepID=A0ABX0GXJ3_9ACTN|nr:Xaa-Pro peptidase family protein [Motilibacter deserti]NHC14339.1 aminopeptidase P family protein [Motilibacter deserti]
MSASASPVSSSGPSGEGAVDRVSALRGRLERARAATLEAGLDALLVTPGPDLRYLTGYDAVTLERLTCLVVRAYDEPLVVVPQLERAAALASPIGSLGLGVATWQETDDPYAIVAATVPGANRVAVDDRMWAVKALEFRRALPNAEQEAAGVVLRELRMRKDAPEVAALRAAGAAIDRVHARVGEWLRAGRTEREVARDIVDAILAEGHVRADFAIVASGPNGASPHHEVSDRVISPGDPVVVDIGGTTEEGYCSDSTRTYAVGEPPADFLAYYGALQAAQEAACAAASPGMPCEEVDRAAREVLEEAGWGEKFIHRTGHGIGLETHEDPYIVAGNLQLLEPGMAFSVEPGVYVEGRHGARIEDIVVCTADGAERLNARPRDLVVLDA